MAALLQYFFTAVFSWMLCEGLVLYFLLVKIFNTGLGERKLFYFALGWGKNFIFCLNGNTNVSQYTGIPVPIVAISAGVAHDQYGYVYDDLWVILLLSCIYIIVKYVAAG